jgi:hypothetical protein
MQVYPRLLIAYVLTTIKVKAKENIDLSMAIILQCGTVIKIIETMFWYIHAGVFQKQSLEEMPGMYDT